MEDGKSTVKLRVGLNMTVRLSCEKEVENFRMICDKIISELMKKTKNKEERVRSSRIDFVIFFLFLYPLKPIN